MTDISLTLTYECDCGARALESRRHCKKCGRENPYWVGEHGHFADFTLSERSAVLDGQRREEQLRYADDELDKSE